MFLVTIFPGAAATNNVSLAFFGGSNSVDAMPIAKAIANANVNASANARLFRCGVLDAVSGEAVVASCHSCHPMTSRLWPRHATCHHAMPHAIMPCHMPHAIMPCHMPSCHTGTIILLQYHVWPSANWPVRGDAH